MSMLANVSQQSISTNIPLDADLQRADQFSNYCANLARILQRAPLFDGRSPLGDKFKAIPLARKDDARICEIFNRNSAAILGENRAWYIHGFGNANNLVFDRKGKSISHGVALQVFDRHKMCSLEELEKAYEKVFSQMATGWVKVDSKDYPNTLFQQNPNEFDLFIKETPMIEESTLVNAIASRFSLSKDVRCHDLWIPSWGPTVYGRPYLWIRKSALPDVVEKMKFKFENRRSKL